mmetsp:Transcript_13726/g.40154  ORF Transcript_13726/g.40154 Transcript_13726/m.40154 type:complete len:296 (-) Transcript_13726:199-1086(-)|eukprot:CAMPEP_0113546576 /NCGR_PEP_ID=MMETSP0015_2-20120614/11879_1 /TAXON_ID=2838 /ORGANISM="Odontella" /LENGTH=295 /DNA_ID=CAMNT_0000447039 /DNA_START=40 /DNA_END=927 /DNA_ORIENTATION=- /assembly_acc=CAM_ASM_000160
MIMPKTALVSIAALALASSSADAFAPPAFLRTDAPGASSSSSSSALSMGKSQTTPGPSSAGSSGPATSEYRMKKMSKRMKGKKKKGGFSDKDFDDDKSSSKAAAIMEHELAAEPEGGEGVQPLVAGTEEIGDFIIRIKDLGPVDESDEAYDLKEELGTPVHNFWLTALVNGKDVQKTRNIVLKDSAKHANFPGFRPGQIPPYAQPKMTFFALQETLVSSCQQSIKIFGVNEINKDQLGAVTFNENVEDLSKIYDTKKCPSIPFTANFRGSFDPDAVRQSAEEDATENEAEEESDE